MINHMRLDLIKIGSHISIPSLTTTIGPWTVNGAIEIPNYLLMGSQSEALNWLQLHSKIDGWIRNYQSISKKVEYGQSFVHFSINQMPNGLGMQPSARHRKWRFGSSQIRGLSGKFHYQPKENTKSPCVLYYLKWCCRLQGRFASPKWKFYYRL